MDALTWFKSVFHRAPAPSGADSDTDAVVPLHVAAARLRPAPAADDEDWGVLIARAKMQAAAPKAPFPPPLPPPRHPSLKVPAPPPRPRHTSPETEVTPPPSPGRQVPPPFKTRGTGPAERANATLDAFIQGRRGTTAPRLALVRRPAEEDLATPPPTEKFRATHAFGRGPARR